MSRVWVSEAMRTLVRRVVQAAGVVVAVVAFVGIALCEGFLARNPSDVVQLVWLLPSAACWGVLLLAVLLVCWTMRPRRRWTRPLIIVVSLLSPVLAWPLTQLTVPLADLYAQKELERWRAGVEDTNRRHVAELTTLLAGPHRVVERREDSLVLANRVAVELYGANRGQDGVFESILDREVVGRVVSICFPVDFPIIYRSDASSGIHGIPNTPGLRPYSDTPVFVFLGQDLVNLRFAAPSDREQMLRHLGSCRPPAPTPGTS